MAKQENFYEKFKINSDASEAMIQKVYRALIRKFHPDVYKGQNAEQKTKRINEIYEVLSDPVKRAMHDAQFGFDSLHVYIYQSAKEKAKAKEETPGDGKTTAAGKTTGSAGGKKTTAGTKKSAGTKSASAGSGKTTAKTVKTATAEPYIYDDSAELKLRRELADLSERIALAEDEHRAELEKQIAETDAKIDELLNAAAAAKAAAEKAAARKAAAEKRSVEKPAEENGQLPHKKTDTKKTVEETPAPQKKTGKKSAGEESPAPQKKTDTKKAAGETPAPQKKTDTKKAAGETPAPQKKASTKKTAEDTPAPLSQSDSEAAPQVATVELPKTSGGKKGKKGEKKESAKQPQKNIVAEFSPETKEFSEPSDEKTITLDFQSEEIQKFNTEDSFAQADPALAANTAAAQADSAPSSETIAQADPEASAELYVLSGPATETKAPDLKPEKPKKLGKPEKPEKPEKPKKLGKPEKPGKDKSRLSSKPRKNRSAAVLFLFTFILLAAVIFYSVGSTVVSVTGDTGLFGGLFGFMEGETHEISYTVNEGGTVEGETSQKVKHGKNGRSVTAVAINEDWYFDSWSDGVKTAMRFEESAQTDIAVQAVFKPYLVVLYQTADDSGNPVGSIIGGCRQLLKDDGSGAAAVTAVADNPDEYRFIGWYHGGERISQNAMHTAVPALAGKTVTARFAATNSAAQHTLLYLPGANGDIVGNLYQSVFDGMSGTSVKAVAAEGYYFVGWYENNGLISADETHTANSLKGDRTIEARFERYRILTYLTDGYGYVTNASQKVKLGADGKAAVATATQNSGYIFIGWFDSENNKIDITGEEKNKHIATAVTQDITITVRFEKGVTVRYSTEGNGTVENASAELMQKGTDGPSVTAAPASQADYFIGWKKYADGAWAFDHDNPSRQELAVVEDCHFIAVFGRKAVVTVETTGGSAEAAGGTVEGDCTQYVIPGAGGTELKAKAAEGYYFAGWFIAGSDAPVSTAAAYTPESVDADILLRAVFLPEVEVEFSVRTGDGGTVTLSPLSGNGLPAVTQGGLKQLGDCVPVTATPDTDWYFIGWFLDDVKVTGSLTLTVSSGTADLRYEARFERFIQYSFDVFDIGTGIAEGTVYAANGMKYKAGESVSARAVPAYGYSFAFWRIKEDGESADWICLYGEEYSGFDEVFTMTADKSMTVQAVFIKGAGIVSDEYQINDYMRLLALNRLGVGEKAYFKLMSAIEMPQNHIPLCPEGFTGSFDGNNIILTGLRINAAINALYQNPQGKSEAVKSAGLFAYLKTGAVIKDLTIHNSSINIKNETDKLYAGMIAGVAAGAQLSGITIGNDMTSLLTVSVLAESAREVFAGGILGGMFGGSLGTSTVQDTLIGAENYADLSGVYAGGVCGDFKGASFNGAIKVTECTINGSEPQTGTITGRTDSITPGGTFNSRYNTRNGNHTTTVDTDDERMFGELTG